MSADYAVGTGPSRIPQRDDPGAVTWTTWAGALVGAGREALNSPGGAGRWSAPTSAHANPADREASASADADPSPGLPCRSREEDGREPPPCRLGIQVCQYSSKFDSTMAWLAGLEARAAARRGLLEMRDNHCPVRLVRQAPRRSASSHWKALSHGGGFPTVSRDFTVLPSWGSRQRRLMISQRCRPRAVAPVP